MQTKKRKNYLLIDSMSTLLNVGLAKRIQSNRVWFLGGGGGGRHFLEGCGGSSRRLHTTLANRNAKKKNYYEGDKHVCGLSNHRVSLEWEE